MSLEEWMNKDHHILRGAIAGTVGGLLASWIMNEFMVGVGPRLTEAVENEEQKREEREKGKEQQREQSESATMKAADEIVSTATGGQHLSWEAKQKAGPVVHYVFGSSVGALYGVLAEYWPAARSNLGTVFGGALFAGADLMAVPVLDLGPSLAEEPTSKLVSPFAAHLVYGTATELVRRLVRKML